MRQASLSQVRLPWLPAGRRTRARRRRTSCRSAAASPGRARRDPTTHPRRTRSTSTASATRASPRSRPRPGVVTVAKNLGDTQLRPLRRRRPRQRRVDALCAPEGDVGRARPDRRPGPGARAGRQQRQQHRPAPPLRGAPGRHRRPRVVQRRRLHAPAPRSGPATASTCRWSATGTATASDDLGVYRRHRGKGRFVRLVDGTTSVVKFGRSYEQPLVGDWDGDGVSDVGSRIAQKGEVVTQTCHRRPGQSPPWAPSPTGS